MFHRVHLPATSNSPVPSPLHTERRSFYLAVAGCTVALVLAGVIAF
jgi:hypothetical protein